MKTLTIAFDVQLNDNEDYLQEGTILEVADVWKQYEGSTPVIVKEALNYKGKPVKVSEIAYFMNCTFKELRSL
jgi:DNA/RNA endonuclease YhcR with UshA esterase domain